MNRRIWLATLATGLLVVTAACGGSSITDDDDSGTDTTTVPTRLPIMSVKVSGRDLVDGAGNKLRLRGVNRSGTEYACIQGWGIFDGPSTAAAATAIASWGANVVRVPLNESCWLGLHGVKPEYGGANYQAAIAAHVARFRATGLAVILELHWAGPGTTPESGQQPMPNREHTPEFWRQVASSYKSDQGVIFDLFNEPFPDGNRDTQEAWRCWSEGGACAGLTYVAAGMKELVTAVRGTGAANVIMIGGVQYAGTLTQWLERKPADPLNNLAASWHVYEFGWCRNADCWESQAAPVARQVPLIVGEIGQSDGGNTFVTKLMDWLDTRNASYLAWVWNVWGSPMDLIANYDGTPTSYGSTFRTRFER